MKWPAVIAGLEVVPSQIPPFARTVKVLGPGEVKPVRREKSLHTNEPSSVAFASFPAAKLCSPLAVLPKPPGISEYGPLAMFCSPPATDDQFPLAVLTSPAAVEE